MNYFNSTIEVTPCLCGCGKMPTKDCKGYYYEHLPDDIKKKIGSKHKIYARNRAKRLNLTRKVHLVQKEVGAPKKAKKRQKAIPKFSKKMVEELKKYVPLKRKFLKEHPICECGRNECKRPATDIHHKKGRIGTLLNDVRFWLPVARICHKWIEEHPKEATELGLTISRHTND